MVNKEHAIKAADIIDGKKGKDIVILDVSENSSFTDFFVIAHGTSERQLKTLAEEVEKVFFQRKELQLPGTQIESTEGLREMITRKPHVVVNLANQEPDGSNLRALVSSKELHSVARLLGSSVDVKFALSRLMGYGMYRKCLYSIDQLSDLL